MLSVRSLDGFEENILVTVTELEFVCQTSTVFFLSGNGARRQRKLSRMKIFTRFNISHDLQLSLCGYTSWYSPSKIDLIYL